jgi:hypothetical protein
MNKIKLSLNLIAVLAICLISASMAQAQATRTWVSGVGDDLNPCSRTAPCKTYAGAISKTAKDGEISTLDPGGFGAVTITKSITINGGGGGAGYGSILSALAPAGVTVNITDPADVRKTVRLDWLNLNGASTGTHGVRILAASKVSIENTLIDGFTTNGVEINVAATTEVGMRYDSVRNSAGNGVSAFGTGTAVVSISDSSFFGNGTGVRANDFSRVSVVRSVAASNTTAGFVSNAQTAGRQAELNLVDSAAYDQNIGTGKGVVAGGTTTGNIVRMGNTSVFTNITGVSINASNTVNTYGNNMINGNGTDLSGSLTAFPVGTGLR